MKIDKGNKKKRKQFKPISNTKVTIQKKNTPIVETKNKECCICNENNFVFNTECNHFICLQCITNLEQTVCPLCRKSLDNLPEKIKMMIPAYQRTSNIIHDDSEDDEFPESYSTENLIDLTNPPDEPLESTELLHEQPPISNSSNVTPSNSNSPTPTNYLHNQTSYTLQPPPPPVYVQTTNTD